MRKAIFNDSLWVKIVEDKYNEKEYNRREILCKIKKILKDYFARTKVKKVYIIGSILEEGAFYDFSDIDIAVEGLEERYFKVSSELENLIGREVEIIELERCGFSDYLVKNGMRVI